MKLTLSAVLGLMVLAAAVPVDATTVRRLANEELTHEADLIVIGKALESKTQWVGRSLYTVVTVQVTEALKGEAGAQIQVALPGGRDTQRKFPIAVTYAGAPTLSRDEPVVLFLVGGRDISAYAIAGFAQGKYTIVVDEAGTKRVARDLTRVEVQDASGVSRGTRTFQPLSELVSEIRGYLERER
jgi:hypothetical protein